MYIRKVEIQNFRAFKEFEIILSNLSLIIGENEAGKTNLFDALSLPLNSNDISFNQKRLSVSDINRQSIIDFYTAILSNKPDTEIKSLIPKVLIKIEFTAPQGAVEEQVLSKWLTQDESGQSYCVQYSFRPKDEKEFIENAKEILNEVTDIKDTHWFSLPIEHYDYDITSTNNGKKVSYSDLKHIAINSINAERDDFSDNSTQKSNGILTKMLVNSLASTDKSLINSSYSAFFDSIENTDTFKKIVKPDPEFKNFFDHLDKLECIPNLPNLKSILSNITLKSGESYLYQRGLGYRNLVYIFLLFEFFKSNSYVFNLCCIEEPEAHLSINNLRFVTDFIYKSTKGKKSSLQTLVSSHSPLVINKLELSNVIVLSDSKAIQLKDSSNELSNYLRKRPNFDILKLLFSDRTILVEGPTEEMLINSILCNDNENINRVEVISIGQKGYKTFMDIWLQVNKNNSQKKLGIIRDYDNQYNAKAEHDRYDDDNDNIIVRTTEKYTLEDDLVSAGNNLTSLQTIFGRKTDNDEKMVKFLKDGKAECMLRICDAIFQKDKTQNITLPKHIQDVLEFMK
ncbi:conjugal transfer protein [Xenorhabdus mauleonii]|uniref:Conjugal transfer protein n=1 Tax=Xenorhabdus mauleonii TaxID=351675 RepID=A0A1I3VD85_9GAMM|nr:AAA family ATPase [Xenorhabdus mauleonii]PHM39014.1 conjugal transfer protein [Xenorhabdus mauleonii]SFJ93394.1 Predicted ATP-dependent endonuclease of the OLD family, contains P-loop ATPase and TOPRIM domains [Xenorhabdus mauleonii]